MRIIQELAVEADDERIQGQAGNENDQHHQDQDPEGLAFVLGDDLLGCLVDALQVTEFPPAPVGKRQEDPQEDIVVQSYFFADDACGKGKFRAMLGKPSFDRHRPWLDHLSDFQGLGIIKFHHDQVAISDKALDLPVKTDQGLF